MILLLFNYFQLLFNEANEVIYIQPRTIDQSGIWCHQKLPV